MKKYKIAKSIVQTLHDKGYVAYFAGGWVRDHLLSLPCDDIDIATNATPKEVQSIFSKTIPIGIAFGIVLVVLDEYQFEVATFRKDFDYQDGRHPSSVAFTTAKEDAMRRDFTINGMFFDPLSEKVMDYVEGEKDLKGKIIRAIGNPNDRIEEDRLRMIRAIRLSARFGFAIEENTKEAILAHAKKLFPSVAIERVWQEFCKMADYDCLKEALLELKKSGLLTTIFPELENLSSDEIGSRLYAIDDFPKKAPTIAYIMELFAKNSLDEKITICRYLKLSNEEIQFITFLDHTYELCKNKTDLFSWAHFYSNPLSLISLSIYAAHLPPMNRAHFLKKHKTRKEKLKKAIMRIEKNQPLVGSSDLIKEKIAPGPIMGKLLKEAEKLSINENIEDPKFLLETLKKSSLWPKRGEKPKS